MVSALLKLREASLSFSSTERAAAGRILEAPELVEQNSIHELARLIFVSPSTIVRLCAHAGFSGYKEFRKAVCAELTLQKHHKKQEREALGRADSLEDIVDKITYKNIMSLEHTKNLIDVEAVRRCVEMIRNARFIYLFGMGASLCAAKDAHLKFLRLNKPCFVNEDWHSQLLQARNATDRDVGIIFSYSGNTVEVVECMKAMKANGTGMIAITRCEQSPVSRLADENIYTTASESLFRSGAMASRISQLNIIDILYTALTHGQYEQSLNQLSRTHIHKPDEDLERKTDIL